VSPGARQQMRRADRSSDVACIAAHCFLLAALRVLIPGGHESSANRVDASSGLRGIAI
jgi:hypothetical protein